MWVQVLLQQELDGATLLTPQHNEQQPVQATESCLYKRNSFFCAWKGSVRVHWALHCPLEPGIESPTTLKTALFFAHPGLQLAVQTAPAVELTQERPCAFNQAGLPLFVTAARADAQTICAAAGVISAIATSSTAMAVVVIDTV
jgi:hypothetical protein